MAWCVLQVQPPPPSPVQTLLVNSADTVTCLHPAPGRGEDREEGGERIGGRRERIGRKEGRGWDREGGEGRIPGGREKSDKEVSELIRTV